MSLTCARHVFPRKLAGPVGPMERAHVHLDASKAQCTSSIVQQCVRTGRRLGASGYCFKLCGTIYSAHSGYAPLRLRPTQATPHSGCAPLRLLRLRSSSRWYGCTLEASKGPYLRVILLLKLCLHSTEQFVAGAWPQSCVTGDGLCSDIPSKQTTYRWFPSGVVGLPRREPLPSELRQKLPLCASTFHPSPTPAQAL
jgi:hypothetical protein